MNLLPEQGWFLWESCAAALDGCIYSMPCNARRIMKLDPKNKDEISSVGDNLGNGKWVVVGIMKYDPINDITSSVGEVAGWHRGKRRMHL